MHLLWASNYTAQSSYANAARLIVPRLAAMGHRVTVLELGVSTNTPRMVGNIQVLPVRRDMLGHDIVQEHVRRLAIDAVITFVDVWGTNGGVYGATPWYPYVPVDHAPVPPAVATNAAQAKRLIAMSQFGVEQLRMTGADPLYVPLAYDPSVFFPTEKTRARRVFGLSDSAFIATFIGVNDSVPSRKGIPELLAAWSIFAQGKRDVLLYMHTAKDPSQPGNPHSGVNIDVLVSTFGIDPRTVQLVDQYRYSTGIPQVEIAELLRAADVFVLPSRGEGFGLPLIEAQAVGTPVITTNFAAQGDLCFGGWLVEGESEWTWQQATVLRPGVASIVESLEAAYAERGNPDRRRAAIEGAQEYRIDWVVERWWRPALTAIAEDILWRVA